MVCAMTGLAQVTPPASPMTPADEEKARRVLREALGQSLGAPGTATTPAAAVEEDPRAAFHRVPFFYGLVILQSLDQFTNQVAERYPGVVAPDSGLVKEKYAEFAKRLDPYFGKPMNSNTMAQLQREIIRFYRKHDRPLVDVLYPEQIVDNGMLHVIVLEARLSAKRVELSQDVPYTNRWTKPEFIARNVRVREQEVIREKALLADLDWLNRNPFRKIDLMFEQSKDPRAGTSDVVLQVVDDHYNRPWSISGGYEDNGSRVTDENRIFAGFTWGKAFGLTDQVLDYRFTADPGFDQLRAHTASYTMPLPWRNALRLFGYYVDVKGELDDGSTLEGPSYQTSARYEVPLPFVGRLQHEFSLGWDFKSSDNSLLFGVQSAVNTPTEIMQAALGYSATLPDAWGLSSLSAQMYYSPGDLTEKNSDEFFTEVHQGATADYVYARFTAERQTKLPFTPNWLNPEKRVFDCFSWILRGTFQVSSANLLPSEQLGQGGYATVRGYEEREVNTDEGWIISNELRTPAFSLLRLFGKKPRRPDQLQFLAFCDYAQGYNKVITDADLKSRYTLLSVGPGLRYIFSPHVEVRFDYGWQLETSGLDNDANGDPRQDSRAHVGVQISF